MESLWKFFKSIVRWANQFLRTNLLPHVGHIDIVSFRHLYAFFPTALRAPLVEEGFPSARYFIDTSINLLIQKSHIFWEMRVKWLQMKLETVVGLGKNRLIDMKWVF